jgi:hypothetical protein
LQVCGAAAMARDLAAVGLAPGGPLLTNPLYATLLPILFGTLGRPRVDPWVQKLVVYQVPARYDEEGWGRFQVWFGSRF